MEKKRVLVVLSGCGVRDGSEVQESVVTLLALDRAGAKVTCAAPDILSFQCIDHYRGVPVRETRNVLSEAARIARGEITPLAKVSVKDIDAIIIPGGLGAVTNLCNFANTQREVIVEPTLKKLLLDAQSAGKPLGFICIAPVIAATLFGDKGIRYTLGGVMDVAERLTPTGAVHVDCKPEEAVVDEQLKIVSTPAYMTAEHLAQIESGITKLVEAVLRLA